MSGTEPEFAVSGRFLMESLIHEEGSVGTAAVGGVTAGGSGSENYFTLREDEGEEGSGGGAAAAAATAPASADPLPRQQPYQPLGFDNWAALGPSSIMVLLRTSCEPLSHISTLLPLSLPC